MILFNKTFLQFLFELEILMMMWIKLKPAKNRNELDKLLISVLM